MTKKKELTEREKIDEVARLFDEIQKVLPTSSIGLTVHDLSLLDLDEKTWEVTANIGKEKNIYLSAKRITGKGIFDIDLYSKDVTNLKNEKDEELL